MGNRTVFPGRVQGECTPVHNIRKRYLSGLYGATPWWKNSRYEQSQGTRETDVEENQALLDELKRRRGERDLPKRFLIVCEDSKSAVNYFEALIKHFNLSAASIHVAAAGGTRSPPSREPASNSRNAATREVARCHLTMCGA